MSKAMQSVIGVAVLVAALLVVAFVRGYTPSFDGGTSARPPCSSLPAKAQVVTALREHADVGRALAEVAPGVEVAVDTPCAGSDADRALLRVTVPAAGRDDLEAWLNTHDGYGVPLQIANR